MRKILGKKNQYYIQTNNAQVELFKDYFGKGRPIACGPTAAAMCLDITGWSMDVYTPGVQPEDAILMAFHNPANYKKLQQRRSIDLDRYPPNEIPQMYEVITKIIYGTKKVCKFSWNFNFNLIKKNINKGIPMLMCGAFPCGGHYVACVGYDDLKEVIIFNDPYPVQWSNKKGYNREMDLSFFAKNISKWRVDFFPKK